MNKIHFIGIGGIGVSALAKYYLQKGHKISGSDLFASEIIQALKKRGAKIFIGPHKSQYLNSDVKQVIYSPAIQPNNPELKKAKKLGIKCRSYPEALGELTKKHFTIAVSGTHGKSTTCAMIGLLLEGAGFDPTVIVGTKLKEFAPHQKNGEGSNCRVGESKYLVIEADEWQASFLNYWPKIIVLTNIEKEHLDYYKNLNHILKTYKDYINHLPKDGILIANKEDKNIAKIKKRIKNAGFKIREYSLRQPETKKLRKTLKILGEHNVYNALASLAVARALGIPDKITFKALSGYKGSWRRFEEKELKINNKKITIVSDYAHHPTEIKATIKVAREKFRKRKIWCVFQPHQYQRTFYLFNDFVKIFKEVPIDKLIITDIYDVAGRERKRIKEKISSKKLVSEIRKRTSNKKEILYISSINEARDYLKRNLQGREVVIIMGAGDVYELALPNFWRKRK